MTTRNRELASIIDDSGNITTGGNLSVTGNLTQSSSTTTTYSDGLLELNTGAGSNSNDLGLVMERGSTGNNAIFLWDESNDGFAVGTTTATGSATGNISFSAAPFTASTITGTILNGSTSVRTPLIEYTDGDDALTIADGGAVTTSQNFSIGGSNNELRFYEGSNYVGFEAPALSADKIWVLPAADGSSGQLLKTDGSGNLSFTDDLTLANASVNNYSGNGSTTGFTLSTTPVSENATQVYINGVYQFKNTYAVSGTTLTFDTAPANGSSIEALVWSTVAINVPADASVTNAKLNASIITGQSEVTAADADHVLIYDASSSALKKTLVSDLLQTSEEIQDIVGAMFTSNTESGITVAYQDGDGTVDFTVGAAQSSITSLGTLSALTISGDLIVDTDTLKVTSGSDLVHIGNTSTGFHSSVHPLIVGSGSGDEGMAIFSGSSNKGKIGFADAASDDSGSYRGYIQYDHNGDKMNIGTAGGTRMHINDAGDVGIGTDTLNKFFNLADPNEGAETLKLHFEAAASTDSWAIYPYDRTNSHYPNLHLGANAALKIKNTGAVDIIDNTLYIHDGKVGIGTTDTGAPLTILTNDSTTDAAVMSIIIRNLSTGTTTPGFGGEIRFQAERNNGVNQNTGAIRSVAEINSGSDISSGLEFFVGTAGVINKKMELTYNGQARVDFGPGYDQLHLSNNQTDNTNKQAGITSTTYTNQSVSLFQMFNQNGSNAIYYGSADGSHRGIQQHYFYSNSNYNSTSGHALQMTINTGNVLMTGNLGVGDTSPAYRVELPNTASSAGQGRANDWNTYSDSRIKSNIQTLSYGLDVVKQLKPSQFKHHSSIKEDGQFVKQEEGANNIGFIAQEVLPLIPEVVSVPDDTDKDLYSISYPRLTAVLTKAIQEQQTIIEDLKTRIETLEG